MCKHTGLRVTVTHSISLANKVSIRFIMLRLSLPPALPAADASPLCESAAGILQSNNLNSAVSVSYDCNRLCFILIEGARLTVSLSG